MLAGGMLPPPPPPGMGPPPGGAMPYPGQEFAQAAPVMPEMSEEEQKRMELENDEQFMKYVKMYKVTKNLAAIKQKMKNEGYEPILIDQFVEPMHARATA
jgi:anaerobic selenocysteine-containing dehydrogenase